MSDFIDRKLLISRIEDLYHLDWKHIAPNMNITQVIEQMPSAEPERKWIPVTEALPGKKEIVLITNNKGHVRCGQYQGTFDDKNYRWWWKNNTLEEVLAWMPLPEPWRGES